MKVSTVDEDGVGYEKVKEKGKKSRCGEDGAAGANGMEQAMSVGYSAKRVGANTRQHWKGATFDWRRPRVGGHATEHAVDCSNSMVWVDMDVDADDPEALKIPVIMDETRG
jgi:hypothetical protein